MWRHARNPAGGKIYRDANGDATGLLEETAIDLVERRIPKPTREQLIAQIIAAQHVYNESGITSTLSAISEASAHAAPSAMPRP